MLRVIRGLGFAFSCALTIPTFPLLNISFRNKILKSHILAKLCLDFIVYRLSLCFDQEFLVLGPTVQPSYPIPSFPKHESSIYL